MLDLSKADKQFLRVESKWDGSPLAYPIWDRFMREVSTSLVVVDRIIALLVQLEDIALCGIFV